VVSAWIWAAFRMCFVKAFLLMADPLIPVGLTNAFLKLQKQHKRSTCLQHIQHQTLMTLLPTTCMSPFNQHLLWNDAVRHCLQEVYFLCCIKCDQFETKNIAEADMEMAVKTTNCCFVNALLIHSILFDCILFSSCCNYLYIKNAVD